MKNYIKKSISLILALFLFVALCSCNESGSASQNTESENVSSTTVSTESDTVSSEIASAESISSVETWQEAYTAFLKNYPVGVIENEHSDFSFRDLDNNDIPELIIIHTAYKPYKSALTVYSYSNNVYKIGEYSDPKVGVSGLRISNNPKFLGLFNLWWGGSVDHYGYLMVEEGKLICENLWITDRTGESPLIKEISDNKELIKESMDAFSSFEYNGNLLDMRPINEDNIAKIIEQQN